MKRPEHITLFRGTENWMYLTDDPWILETLGNRSISTAFPAEATAVEVLSRMRYCNPDAVVSIRIDDPRDTEI